MRHEVETLEELLSHYKSDRYEERGVRYKDCVRNSHIKSLEDCGSTLISNHDSRTGRSVWLIKNI